MLGCSENGNLEQHEAIIRKVYDKIFSEREYIETGENISVSTSHWQPVFVVSGFFAYDLEKIIDMTDIFRITCFVRYRREFLKNKGKDR